MLTKGLSMKIDDLTAEQKEKALACKTPEELLALAKAEGYELSDSDLDAIAGGGIWDGCDIYTPNVFC